MIVRRERRRLFPCLILTIRGLPNKELFSFQLKLSRADDYRYKFRNGAWVISRHSEVHENNIQCYLHPMSPTTGEAWMNAEVSFKELKVM